MVMNVFDVMGLVQPVEVQQNVAHVNQDTGVVIVNTTAPAVVQNVIKKMAVIGAFLVTTKAGSRMDFYVWNVLIIVRYVQMLPFVSSVRLDTIQMTETIV